MKKVEIKKCDHCRDEIVDEVVPSGLFPEQGTFGVWIANGKNADFHVYVQEGWLVIGKNNDTAHMKFTPLCVVIDKDGKIYLQYENKKGECENAPIPLHLLKTELLKFLKNIKEAVV